MDEGARSRNGLDNPLNGLGDRLNVDATAPDELGK
jgi:hypothetical protein